MAPFRSLLTVIALPIEHFRAYDAGVLSSQNPFRLEREMIAPLIAHVPFAFQVQEGQRLRLLREPSIGSVIPDLLLGVWSGDLPRTRVNGISRHILTLLSVDKVSDRETIRQSLFLSHNAATFALQSLERVGAITSRDSGEIELRSEFDFLSSIRLIAIELKLKRWREGLEQAVAYQKFADEAYVVLDADQVAICKEIRTAFMNKGIGLLLQKRWGVVREIPVTPIQPRPSVDRLFASIKLAEGPYCLA